MPGKTSGMPIPFDRIFATYTHPMRYLPAVLAFALLATLASVCSCKKQKATSTGSAAAEPTPRGSGDMTWQPVMVDKGYSWPGSTDPFQVEVIRVNGDTLLVEVSYGGGCKEHQFTLKTNGAWMKSLPPQINLWLEHESHDDMCRALIHTTLRFDLRPVRYAGGEQVVVIVNEDRERRQTYSY